ncbi:oxygen-independent coproporphyrinogen-3 oxidase [Mariprofundus ferrinatatus]|uniref:Heme chaperone HemW n=1 Tax=Mariprofundus ferrinatatus TaxID=1921087 RepID=A0A2K8LCF5_9PROT|nr:radical SAM family heme chaperone HemW [Mariprofundus ferrinatatus]ATX82584.1 oxygen-independent coproporphyrinogen-3 oxidase [Mariprofundus ferrinatatus]
MTELRCSPLLLYVHTPFCVHKCHYCDFNSHERTKPDWESYQQALKSEMTHWACSPMFSSRKLSSIFFGGGTPSLAPPELIASLIDQAEQLLGFEDNLEVTLEANPGTVDVEHFAGFRQAGVNRLSIGVQSLRDHELKWLERIHDSRTAITAFHAARKAGFDNINLDLIYGLPNQTMDQWLYTLQSAINLEPEHLSCYQLTIEPHTRLAASHASSPLPLPNDELALEMFTETRKRLLDYGLAAYEISNFSRPGFKCRHNDGYWRYHDYIGIGAGASGKWDEWSANGNSGINRYSNIRTPERYIASVADKGSAINSQEQLDCMHAAAEAVWLGLRRTNGIDRPAFRSRFGFDVWEHFSAQLELWEKQGMLNLNRHSLALTESGLTLADAIAESVL